MNRHSLGHLLCSTGYRPSDRVSKTVAGVCGAGSVCEVNDDDPVFLSPCVHGDTVGFGLWRAGGSEHQLAAVEVLGDVDVVRGAFARFYLRGTVIDSKHDVTGRANRDENTQLQNIVGALLNGLDGLALRPAFHVDDKGSWVF